MHHKKIPLKSNSEYRCWTTLYPSLDIRNTANSLHQVSNPGEVLINILVSHQLHVSHIEEEMKISPGECIPTTNCPPLLSNFFSSCPMPVGMFVSRNFCWPAVSLVWYSEYQALRRSWMTSMISSTWAISILVRPARLYSLARNLAQAMDWAITSPSHASRGT